MVSWGFYRQSEMTANMGGGGEVLTLHIPTIKLQKVGII